MYQKEHGWLDPFAPGELRQAKWARSKTVGEWVYETTTKYAYSAFDAREDRLRNFDEEDGILHLASSALSVRGDCDYDNDCVLGIMIEMKEAKRERERCEKQ